MVYWVAKFYIPHESIQYFLLFGIGQAYGFFD